MAAFRFLLGTLDLSSYCAMNPDDKFDPYSQSFIEPAFSSTPFSDGQALISTTVENREMHIPLYLKDPTLTKDALHAVVRSINQAAAQRPLAIEWRDSGASASTFYDVVFVRFESDFNYRRSVHGYAFGILHAWVSGYGNALPAGTTRIAATAAGTGVYLNLPIASVAGDAPALMDSVVNAGAVVPSLGRIVAVAPITNPSYAAQIPAASLTDLQVNATLVGASGADGSQYLALPVSPTGGASGVACRVPLPNPTIAGGDNRILAVVQSGIDAGVGMYAVDPFGNSLGATAVASTSQGYSIVDLGVCRLPTVGYPTQPKIAIYAGGIWASGAAGPAVLASPAALRINEVLCLPDKSLALIYERSSGGSVLSKDGLVNSGNAQLQGSNDDLGNPWSAGWHNIGATIQLFRQAQGLRNVSGASAVDSAHLGGISQDGMVISAKALFSAVNSGDVRLFTESASTAYVQARLAISGNASYALDLAAATNTTLNTLASLALATLSTFQKYRLLLQQQGQTAFVNLTRDDGGPVFIPGSAAYASIGVTGNAAVAGAGMPGVAIAIGSTISPYALTWEVDAIPSSNLLPYDNYTLSGNSFDSWRTSSAGVFAGQKLVANQRGSWPKMAPSTTSVAVVCAPVDSGPANDILSAVIRVRERYTLAV
jgi:hypothetical protein